MVYEAYNLSLAGNSSGIVDLMQIVNSELMFDFYGIGILITIFVILLMSFLISTNGDGIKSWATASFICFVISLLLFILELVPEIAIFIFLVMSAIGVVLIRN